VLLLFDPSLDDSAEHPVDNHDAGGQPLLPRGAEQATVDVGELLLVGGGLGQDRPDRQTDMPGGQGVCRCRWSSTGPAAAAPDAARLRQQQINIDVVSRK